MSCVRNRLLTSILDVFRVTNQLGYGGYGCLIAVVGRRRKLADTGVMGGRGDIKLIWPAQRGRFPFDDLETMSVSPPKMLRLDDIDLRHCED